MEELTNAINLKNTHPITDEVGKNLKPFRFKLTNTCGVGVDYNVNLEVMETEYRIASKNIATKVDENAKSILSNNPTAPITYKESDYTAVEAYTIHSGSIEPYGSVEHEVRIWLDESAGNDSQNGTFYSKVVIDGRQNQKVAVAFNEYIINQVEDNPSIEEFEHVATNQTVALTDYRYVGKNPNNYVCFGSEEVPCPEDNLYRIIGVIPTQSEVGGKYENRVKLVKNSFYFESKSGYLLTGNTYHWNNQRNDNWVSSTLNNNVLNSVYWNSLGEYQKYIATSLWYLGGPENHYTDNDIYYSSNLLYASERGSHSGTNGGSINYVSNICLMYPSDYGYSSGLENSGKSIGNNVSVIVRNAWIFIGDEWLVSAAYGNYYIGAWQIRSNGALRGFTVVNSDYNTHIRPVFYLKSNVFRISGNGTQEEPYRISINE